MSNQISLEAELRSQTGKGAAHKIRREGKIPATVYGAHQGPVNVTVDPKTVASILHSESGHNTIVQIQIHGGETASAMIVDWQRDPVKGKLLHVDLKRIAMNEVMRVKVPVVTRGEAYGVKTQGGILEQVTREVEVECLPGQIPEHLYVDVAELAIGQSLRVGDLRLDAGVRLLMDADRVIVHVIAVKESVTATPEAAAPAAEEAKPEAKK